MAAERLRNDPFVFGERYARNAAIGAACLALWTLLVAVIAPSPFPLMSVAGVVMLSHAFRRRALADAERRFGVLEDERDARFLACGDRAFRIAASGWAVGLAAALVIPAARDVLLAEYLRVPGLLLLGVIVANLAGHATTAIGYARARQ